MIPRGTFCLSICASTVLACDANSIDRIVVFDCCLQAQLQSAADLGATNGVPTSVWALQSALFAGQQKQEPHPQPFCAESHKPWDVPFANPFLSELHPSADTVYFQGPTSSDWYLPLSNEERTHCARSSAQAGTVGVNADVQLRRTAFDVRQLHQVLVCVQLIF